MFIFRYQQSVEIISKSYRIQLKYGISCILIIKLLTHNTEQLTIDSQLEQ